MPLTEAALANLSQSAVENINKWLTEPKFAEYKQELEQLMADEKWQDLEDAFFKVLEFGTGGRRGTTGVGSNRINRVTIGESAQALCEYAKSFDELAPEQGVVIACDTRLSSPELSKYTAQVCAAAGFKTYIFDGFRATPELSFAVRYHGAAVGIVISASHNPPADNGFKAYWRDGGQLVAPHDRGVLDIAADITEIYAIDYDQAVQEGKIVVIGEDVDLEYYAAAVAQAEGTNRNVKIVYSPLHGAGQRNSLPVLRKAGFKDIVLVDEQMTPDGNFPTVTNNKANPEERVANDMAVAKLQDERGDIAVTNDPDADRFGVMVRQGEGVVYLSGNQAASLAADYSLANLQAKSKLTSKHYIAKTIVTTDLMGEIAAKYGAKIYENFLVGFKYIGELVYKKEQTDEVFVMGAEESFGFMKGDYTRDKDGAAGALTLAEYAAELKTDGKTLYDRLLELYSEHGVFVERLDNVQSPGADGFAKMQTIMAGLRSDPPLKIGDNIVTAVLDYKSLQRRDLQTGEVTPVDCVVGDVVVFEFGDRRCRLTVRPSGTEPKIKFYTQWYEPANGDIEAQYNKIERHIETLASELEALLFED
ncbi:phospho-sugar mutase [Candidatus Saccharibacteria bacterium]|nr:phospho-sugar mutase [Candidatus Saccharibacteria bacterium]